jgi:DNA-binding NtrC family response regulator
MENLSKRHRVIGKSIGSNGRKNLLAYPWPGNVRELAHELERALVFDDADELNFEALAGRKTALPATTGGPAGDWFNEEYVFAGEGFSLEEAIMRLIRHALAQTDQNVSAAARLLGVSRDYLRYRISGRGEGQDADGEQNAPKAGV